MKKIVLLAISLITGSMSFANVSQMTNMVACPDMSTIERVSAKEFKAKSANGFVWSFERTYPLEDFKARKFSAGRVTESGEFGCFYETDVLGQVEFESKNRRLRFNLPVSDNKWFKEDDYNSWLCFQDSNRACQLSLK